jgi:hypothetical protein
VKELLGQFERLNLPHVAVSPGYLEASVTRAAVAREVGVDPLVSMSPMSVSPTSIPNTTPSPRQRRHWLSELAGYA